MLAWLHSFFSSKGGRMNNNVQKTFDKGAKNLLDYSIEMAMLQRTRAAGILTERQCDEVERSIKKHYHVTSDLLVDIGSVQPYNQ